MRAPCVILICSLEVLMKFYLSAGLVVLVLLFITIPALVVDIFYMIIWLLSALLNIILYLVPLIMLDIAVIHAIQH